MKKELKKIFYIEDDESIAEVAKMALGDVAGFDITHFASGQEALDALKKEQPQLILLDVMMPVMDGVKTFEKIKEIPQAKDIPVIFMTAKAQIHEQDSYIKMGAIGVIAKPFDVMKLSDNIKTLWEKN